MQKWLYIAWKYSFWTLYLFLEGCKNVHYDLAFILDTSSSVGKDNFEKIRQWVANLVDSFDVAPDKTRVAVVRYSDRPTTEFNLARYRTLEDVKRAARNIRYLGGNTMTGDAISYTTSNIFTERNGARPVARGVQRVAILLTDGRSQDYVLEPSKAAAKAGIRMFAVGIGEALKVELEEIAAEPKNAHVFHVTDFNAIDKIRGRLRKRLCESKSSETPPSPQTTCLEQHSFISNVHFYVISLVNWEGKTLTTITHPYHRELLHLHDVLLVFSFPFFSSLFK